MQIWRYTDQYSTTKIIGRNSLNCYNRFELFSYHSLNFVIFQFFFFFSKHIYSFNSITHLNIKVSLWKMSLFASKYEESYSIWKQIQAQESTDKCFSTVILVDKIVHVGCWCILWCSIECGLTRAAASPEIQRAPLEDQKRSLFLNDTWAGKLS